MALLPEGVFLLDMARSCDDDVAPSQGLLRKCAAKAAAGAGDEPDSLHDELVSLEDDGSALPVSATGAVAEHAGLAIQHPLDA